MDKKTRIRLVLGVSERLGGPGLSWSQANLILRTYGLQEYVPEDDWSPSVQTIVEDASDLQLIELAEYFDMDVPEVPAPTAHVSTVASLRPLILFGSHLSAHRVLLGAVREQLLRYGIELFVAHDTIAEDTLWQDEIEKALDRADAGLVFVHKGLRDSAWCDQEIGWLQGRHVPVMALRFDETPYGFFAKHQAQPVPKNANAHAIAEMTVDRIASRNELAPGFAASLVSAIAKSPNFATTDAIWKRLRELTSLDADLCSQLLEATKTNNQIFWADSALDGTRSYPRVISDFLQRQPGAGVIASDIQAYIEYLDQRDAEEQRRNDEVRRRIEAELAGKDPAGDPF